MVTVHAEMDHPGALHNFMADPEAQASMKDADVLGRPEMRLLTKHS